MTDQQAVPVAQEAPGEDWSDDWKAFGFNGAIRQAQEALRYLANHDRPQGGEQFPNSACCEMIANELEITRKRYAALSLPCKSGEGVDLAVWCAREAEARRAEGNSSPHTAKLTREGRYDDQGVMPVAIAAARIALGLSTPDATQTREAEGREIGRALREVPDEVFRHIVDSKCVGHARARVTALMVDLRATLSAGSAGQ